MADSLIVVNAQGAHRRGLLDGLSAEDHLALMRLTKQMKAIMSKAVCTNGIIELDGDTHELCIRALEAMDPDYIESKDGHEDTPAPRPVFRL